MEIREEEAGTYPSPNSHSLFIDVRQFRPFPKIDPSSSSAPELCLASRETRELEDSHSPGSLYHIAPFYLSQPILDQNPLLSSSKAGPPRINPDDDISQSRTEVVMPISLEFCRDGLRVGSSVTNQPRRQLEGRA